MKRIISTRRTAIAYVRAMAETCGAHAAARVSVGTWEPSDFLPGDAVAIRKAAELAGVTLDRSDWRNLFALYAAPSDSAFTVCGLARPVGRWIVEGREALGAWGWECVVGSGGRIRNAASDTEEEAERDVEVLVAQGWDREALRVREALVMA